MEEIKSYNNMSTTSISYVKLEPATNGVILSWTEKVQKGSKNTYDNCSYEDKKEVYDGEEGAADPMESAFDKALPKFKELWKKQYTK